eukprot:358585-Chlamydomonas_euryale.AAC.1
MYGQHDRSARTVRHVSTGIFMPGSTSCLAISSHSRSFLIGTTALVAAVSAWTAAPTCERDVEPTCEVLFCAPASSPANSPHLQPRQQPPLASHFRTVTPNLPAPACA